MKVAIVLSLILGLAHSPALAQDTLGLANGYLTLTTANFNVRIVKNSQTLASLKPTNNNFDYSPFDYLPQRAGNNQYHTGDLNLRYRQVGSTQWTSASTANARTAVSNLAVGPNVLASSRLTPTLPGGIPLDITRDWTNINGDLGLVYTLKNNLSTAIEIGSLGFPIEFNSIFTNRNADNIQALCSLQDPYIGLGAGYVQVTPVNGNNPALVVTPLSGTNFEAWRFLPESGALSYQSQVFEGFYEWQAFSKAWAENEWKNTQPWNPPTSRTLQPNESVKVGLRFSFAKGGVRDIESTIKGVGLPYATSTPGYIVPQDTTSTLYLDSSSTVADISVSPAGAFAINSVAAGRYTLTPSSNAWGRTRVTVRYSNGIVQTLHYYIVKAAPAAVASLGTFLTTSQWFSDTTDPFKRAPSVISYDRSTNRQVLQDSRVWIAGLSDEAGAGSWLAATMKQAIEPDINEIPKLDDFISTTLWGTIQATNFGVRKSVFYHDTGRLPNYPYDTSINWGSWTSWNFNDAYATDRAYDYVHATAAYWAFYRVARAYPGLVKRHTWDWYLLQAYQTIMFVTDPNSGVSYIDAGLMGETVWGEILRDLDREGRTAEASALAARMRTRANNWNSISVPFGSEMAWDSTGQEGVYYWSNYFGLTNTAAKSIRSILAYMPTVPHWGWNGNARRYWDNIYGGKLQRIERQIHHYGSGLNALPLLSYFRSNPDDTYVLRVAYGGISGPLSNIDAGGFASASFHSWPDTLAWDAYSGDYGPNFVGLALGSAVYIVNDAVKGTLVFGGNVVASAAGSVTVAPRDAVRRRVYVGQLGVFIEIDAGTVEEVTVAGQKVTLKLSQGHAWATAKASAAVVWVDNFKGGNYKVTTAGLQTARKGVLVPLGTSFVTIEVGQ